MPRVWPGENNLQLFSTHNMVLLILAAGQVNLVRLQYIQYMHMIHHHAGDVHTEWSSC